MGRNGGLIVVLSLAHGGSNLIRAQTDVSTAAIQTDETESPSRQMLGKGPVEARRLCLGVFVAILLALPAVLPLARPGLPLTDDGLFHIARLIELRQAMAAGDLFPRWVEPFAEGLGFPFLNFYAPLSYYLALSFAAVGLVEGDAFKLALALTPLLSSATMCLWVMEKMKSARVHGRMLYLPALGAAVAYVYAPYQLVEIYRRGALAESLALGLMPLLFFAVDRVRWQPGLNSTLFLSLILSALMLTHNAMALLGVGLVACYILFSFRADRFVFHRSNPRKHIPLLYAVASGLGLGISAFFWLPAILERSYLNFGKLSTGWFSIENHLAYSWPPLQTSLFFDFSQPFRAGLAQGLLMIPGLILLTTVILSRLRSRKAPVQTEVYSELIAPAAFFALSAALIIFLLSPWSAFFWREAPLLKALQFAWRTLGLLALCSAFVTAAGLFWLGRNWPRPFPLAAATGLAVLAITSLVSLPIEFDPVPPQNIGIINAEASKAGWDLRTTQLAQEITSADASALAHLKGITQKPGRIALELETARATTVALHILYFPGWKVYLDGREVPAFPVTDRGLLGFSVAEGSHSVLARFEQTPLRTGAEALSILSVLGTAILLGATAARRRPAWPAIFAAVALGSLIVLPRIAARVPEGPGSEFHSLDLPASGGVRLLGVGLEEPREGRLGITLYWQALQRLNELQSFVALVDAQDKAVGIPIHLPLEGAYPTQDWQVGEIIPDTVWLDESSNLDTSALRLRAGFGTPSPIENVIPTASFRLDLTGKRPEYVSPQQPIQLTDLLELRGYSPSLTIVPPGTDLPVSLHWQARDAIPGNVGVFLHLVDSKGEAKALADAPPGPKSYPAVLWSRGERVREERQLAIPEDASLGRYTLQIGAYRYPSLERLKIGNAGGATHSVLGTVFVVAPQTRPTSIAPKQPMKVTLGDLVELVGYDVTGGELRPGQELALTTYWRAIRPVPSSYTIFSHVIDQSGAVRGQNDGEPANNSYPTFLWQPGEYVVDTRTIKLEAEGTYRLAVGLYQWPSLERLEAFRDGASIGSAAELGTLQVLSTSP